MNKTRRDFLRISSAGLGAAAAVGAGDSDAKGCWFQKEPQTVTTSQKVETQRKAKTSSGAPEIRITSMTSGWQIGRSFSVYGTWDITGWGPNAPDSIECYLRYSNDATLATGATTFSGTNSGDWVSDFVVPDPPASATGLKLVVVMIVNAGEEPRTAQIVDLELLVSTLQPITITAPLLLRAPKEFAEEPKGNLDDANFDISAVTSVYVESGTDHGGKKSGGKKIGKAKKSHHTLGSMEWKHTSQLGKINPGTRGSLVVTATHTPKGSTLVRTYTVALHNIKQS